MGWTLAVSSEVSSSYAKPPRAPPLETRIAMHHPRIAAVATATPAHRFTPGRAPRAWPGTGTSAVAASSRPATSPAGTSTSTPSTSGPNESVDELSARFRRGALELGEQAARAALDRAGWAPRSARLHRHHHLHGPAHAEPRRPPGRAPRLSRRRAARARRRHRLRLRRGRAPAGVEPPARVPRPPGARARRRDLLGRLLPRRAAGERGRPRDLRRRRRRRGPAPATAPGRPSSSTARCSGPSTSTPWASSIQAGGRG